MPCVVSQCLPGLTRIPFPRLLTPQDKPWREQQRRLLSAQFGPKEVERLAVNEMVPLPGEEDSTTGKACWQAGGPGCCRCTRGAGFGLVG